MQVQDYPRIIVALAKPIDIPVHNQLHIQQIWWVDAAGNPPPSSTTKVLLHLKPADTGFGASSARSEFALVLVARDAE